MCFLFFFSTSLEFFSIAKIYLKVEAKMGESFEFFSEQCKKEARELKRRDEKEVKGQYMSFEWQKYSRKKVIEI